MKSRLVLVDANALIHRSFHAIPHLSTKSGQPINAVYGFFVIFLNMIRDLKPQYLVCAFDLAAPTFRHKEFAGYKAKRVKAPQELYDQIPMIKKILEAMSIPIFEKEGFEADDIIGTIAAKAYKQVDEIIIVTGDLDTLQLVNDKVKVYTMRRGLTDTVIYDQGEVEQRYGFEPKLLIEYKGLRGDASDNIPGVAGIGEKTAQELIKEYQTIENIFKNLEILPNRAKKVLTGKIDEALFSKKLSEIVLNVPVNFDLKASRLGDYDRQKTVKIFSDLEFRSLLNKLPGATAALENLQGSMFDGNTPIGKAEKAENKNYHLISTEKELSQLLAVLEKQKALVIDCETDILSNISSQLIGISISYKASEAYYIPKNLFEKAKPQLKVILENPKIAKIGQNLKYDYQILKRNGIKILPISFDTMIAASLLNPNSHNHNLEQLAFVELGYEMTPIEDLIGKGKDQITFDKVANEKVSQYSCEDADMTFRLYQKFLPQLKSQDMEKLFYEIEMPQVPILADMELAGVKIDEPYFKKLAQKVKKRIVELKKKIYKIAGCEFNISSTQQLAKILFCDLKISTTDIKKIKTGRSTAAGELEKLKGKHEIIDLLVKYRELTKLSNTYLEALPKLINPKTKRLHTSYNQTVTATGRLSSSDPNLQNIPIRSDLGQQIRRGFVAEKSCVLISADYSQIELRIVAHIARDAKMIKAFQNGEDIHAATASEIFSISENKVDAKMRRTAKTINFGIIYGLSSYGLAQTLSISREEAQNFIDKYFLSYSGIKKYTERIIDEVREKGFVQTLAGRKRFLPEINSGMAQVRNSAERMAINMPIQGTAAEIMKKAMIEVNSKVKSKKVKVILTVHDELVFECPAPDAPKAAVEVKEIMENVMKLSVPLKVDIKIGQNWEEME